MKRHIYLIGFMGTGKSTVSRALKKHLGWDEVDIDAVIEKQQKKSIANIFAEYGEEYFRNLETDCLKQMCEQRASIISCGGGAVLRDENVDIMKKSGVIVLLTATPETVFSRVKHSKNRPILNGNMNIPYIAQLMERRRALYESASQVTVKTDGKTPAEIVAEICGVIEL